MTVLFHSKKTCFFDIHSKFSTFLISRLGFLNRRRGNQHNDTQHNGILRNSAEPNCLRKRHVACSVVNSYAEFCVFIVIVMLSAVVLNVAMPRVVAPFKSAKNEALGESFFLDVFGRCQVFNLIMKLGINEVQT
jgi:hypothetical protein